MIRPLALRSATLAGQFVALSGVSEAGHVGRHARLLCLVNSNSNYNYNNSSSSSSSSPRRLFHTGLVHLHSHSHSHSHSQSDEIEIDKSLHLSETERTELQQKCERVTKLGAYSNVLLAVAKAVVGVVSGSVAMIADAAHSIGDLASDFITLYAVKQARKPADSMHPFGHGRVETVGTLAISSLLVMTGLGMGLHGYEALYDPHEFKYLPYVLGVAGFSILLKESLFWMTLRAGEKAGSKVMMANAWHHRADSISSVVAFIGTAGVLCGLPWFDAASAMAVSVMIAKVGFDFGIGSVRELLDQDVDHELRKEIAQVLSETIKKIDGFHGYQALRLRRMGPYVGVDVHLELDSQVSITSAHQIGNVVRAALLESHEEISDVIISTGPEGLEKNSPIKDMRPEREIRRDVLAIVKHYPKVLSVTQYTHHILHSRLIVRLDLYIDPTLTIREASQIANQMREEIERIPDIQDADIHLELLESTQVHG